MRDIAHVSDDSPRASRSRRGKQPQRDEPRSIRGQARRPFHGYLLAFVACALFIGSTVGTPAQPASSPQATPASEPTDPFGRTTPRGTITGLNLAVHKEDFVSAALYMQLTPSLRKKAEQLARDLTALIDHYYVDPITSISGAPEGRTIDGLPLDRERVALKMGKDESFDVILVRIKDPQSGFIWLISSQTLNDVPKVEGTAEERWFEAFLPPALKDKKFLGISAARWAMWAATLLVPPFVLWLITALIMTGVRTVVSDGTSRRLIDSWYGGLRRPVLWLVALSLHLACVPLFGFALRTRLVYTRVVLIAVVTAVAWLFWRLMALSLKHLRIVAEREKRTGVQSLLLLTERVGKVVVVLVTVFALLTIAGVDTSTALAGVGLGGVAVALGAQKTVENLLGGVFLLSDRALAVGDTCSISNRVGTVEDVTLRSVRLRTAEQTLLSVPAGILSQSSLENLTSRTKILLQNTLRVRYGSTTSQLRQILTGIRDLLDKHPSLEAASARIRLVNFGERAIELELFAYVLTSNWVEFLTVREELLLQVAAIIEESGTAFAQPSVVLEEATGVMPEGGLTEHGAANPIA
jgi:MscS family membrane protein